MKKRRNVIVHPNWVLRVGYATLIVALLIAVGQWMRRDRFVEDQRYLIAGLVGFVGLLITLAGSFIDPRIEVETDGAPAGPVSPDPWTKQRVLRTAWPWLVTGVFGGIAWFAMRAYLLSERAGEPIVWKNPRALWLVAGAAFVGLVAFHVQRRRAATLGFSSVGLVGARGAGAWLSDLPGVLRVLAVAALAVGLARPETYRTVKHEVDTVDIMLVVDMSKSMEEIDMPNNRLDAAQRVIRRFLRRTKNDRIGLVIFGQQAMLQCPLTQDTKLLEQIVSDLGIGDVPELGTAIGDGLALALAQLRRSDAKSKVVILLSDGDSNWVTRFDPDEAARTAQKMGVKVYTLLVGREETDLFGGGMSVNPATLRSIANATGGEFFRASDYESFDRGFQTVRNKLDTTKRTVTERIPDKQLFVPLVILAGALIALELLLSYGRLRRLP
ncbi:MAG: VWA domain-containing protein [Deltaproteobacteria bacterium]|nr:VWA domain-containing protein [Deltaproteobacteria bacterium]